MPAPKKIRVCFVCLGNICRSPTAEGVMRAQVLARGLADRFTIESAGTAAYHEGEKPDRRSRAAARLRGIELSSRARQFVRSDFPEFDYVLAMDRENLGALHALARGGEIRKRVVLLRSFEAKSASPRDRAPDVPDPYYGGPDGFERVLEICEASCTGLLDHIIAADGLE